MRLRRLEPVIRRALRGPCALPPGSRLLVAVSGGADSVALLMALDRVAHEFGLSLRAAHLHHGLRGAEAGADLAFVRALCERLEVGLIAARWDTRARMRRRGLSGENGLRTLRREFLREAARRAGAAAIATAHTADDQLETVIMRLLRGAGLTGLGGMSARRGTWLKPLLDATRADVEADLRAIGQPWREDLTNRDPSFTRNRIRHDAIPALLRAMDPALDPATARPALARRVARIARETRDAARALRIWTRPVAVSVRPTGAALRHIGPAAMELDSAAVRSYPIAARRTILRHFWKRFTPNGPGLTHRHLEALDRLLAGKRAGARVGLPGDAVAMRTVGAIRFTRADSRPARKRVSCSDAGTARVGRREAPIDRSATRNGPWRFLTKQH